MESKPSDGSYVLLDGQQPEDTSVLGKRYILFYGVGHMLNDLTSACWFTYLLIFLTDVGLSPSDAALVMLSGQLADGIATIFVGELIDRFGHFKLWHAGGSALVAVSFSSVFGKCWLCSFFDTYSEKASTIAYIIFAAIFNIGWAATQVSHMSLVNCLSSDSTTRVALTSCRNAFSMVANLCLFGIAYMIFQAFPAKNPFDVEKQYRCIAQISIALGCCFILIFLSTVREPRLDHLLQPKEHPKISSVSWFKRLLYHQVALVYIFTRLATNVSQALLAFYVIDDLDMRDSAKAVVPAIIYVSGFVVSIVLQQLGHWNGSRIKLFFMLGAFLWILCGSMIYVLTSASHGLMFGLFVVIGAANALMMVTAVSMEGVLVGLDISGCAFVYASLSFLDKLSCGVALYGIEAFHAKREEVCRPEAIGRPPCHTSNVRLMLALVPAGCAFLGILVTLMMKLDISSSLCCEEPLLSTASLDEPTKELIYSWPVPLSPSSKSLSEHRINLLKRLGRAVIGQWGSSGQHDRLWLS